MVGRTIIYTDQEGQEWPGLMICANTAPAPAESYVVVLRPPGGRMNEIHFSDVSYLWVYQQSEGANRNVWRLVE